MLIYFIVTHVKFAYMIQVSLLKVNIHTDGYFGLSEEDYEYKRGNVCEW